MNGPTKRLTILSAVHDGGEEFEVLYCPDYTLRHLFPETGEQVCVHFAEQCDLCTLRCDETSHDFYRHPICQGSEIMDAGNYKRIEFATIEGAGCDGLF